jgi:hypothetical protein
VQQVDIPLVTLLFTAPPRMNYGLTIGIRFELRNKRFLVIQKEIHLSRRRRRRKLVLASHQS